MLKNIVRLEHQINGRVYHFLSDNDAPLSDVKETLFKFVKYVMEVEEKAISSQQQNIHENAEQCKEEDKKECEQSGCF